VFNKKYITFAHLEWAAENRVIITEGECGFGRPCVGITTGDQWIDWRATTGAPDYRPEPDPWEGFVPPDAYHKHDCVAVLGQDDLAWSQLADWLTAIMDARWIVLHLERTPKDTIDLVFHGLTTARLGKPKEIPAIP
jgi:hypothetical protein